MNKFKIILLVISATIPYFGLGQARVGFNELKEIRPFHKSFEYKNFEELRLEAEQYKSSDHNSQSENIYKIEMITQDAERGDFHFNKKINNQQFTYIFRGYHLHWIEKETYISKGIDYLRLRETVSFHPNGEISQIFRDGYYVLDEAAYVYDLYELKLFNKKSRLIYSIDYSKNFKLTSGYVVKLIERTLGKNISEFELKKSILSSGKYWLAKFLLKGNYEVNYIRYLIIEDSTGNILYEKDVAEYEKYDDTARREKAIKDLEEQL